MSTRNQKLEALFEAALALGSKEQRSAYLDQACPDADLRREVESLLESHRDPDSLLAREAAEATEPAILERSGDQIGRYKLLEKLGEGGFGVVYMAEQREPVKRRVALKIIKLGMDTRQVIARFEAERQALALMDHPNIAKVFDGGVTGESRSRSYQAAPESAQSQIGNPKSQIFPGRPYFVMELVRGVPITDYCDEANLSTTQRLNLFTQVCRAVQHAHQKGVIHRDLKPSNILVTINDGVPVPKVIDFGVAKAAAGQTLTDKTVFTAFAQFIGTPAYMSPEQALMTSLDIDTRSDIYSLGVLLYELLTGRPPFDAREMLAAGLDAMRRTIREKEPARPSARLSTLAHEDLTTAAKRRATDAPRLIHALEGDLDWIVMKCLEKDRSRRYDTANGLAADIQRHFTNEPIVARPPSTAYRFQKAIRRNRVAFTAAGAIAFTLVLGLGLAIWQAIRAEAAQHEQTRLRLQAEASERAAKTETLRSEHVSKFFQDMLKGVGPSVALGRDTTLLREILDKTMENLGADLKEEPSIEAQLRNTVGYVYLHLGDLPRAEVMVREALVLRSRLNGGEHKEVARSLELLGHIHVDRSEYAQAEAAHLEAYAIRRRIFGDSHESLGASFNNLGIVLGRRGELAGAAARYREAMEIDRRFKGEEGLVPLQNLAAIHSAKGEYAEAERLLRHILEKARQEKGNENPDVADVLYQMALNFADQGDQEKAAPLYREALAIYRKVMPANHPELVRALQSLADTLRLKGDLAGAETAYREALAVWRQNPGHDDKLAAALFMVSTVLHQRRQFAEAESLLRESLAIRERLHGRESREVAEVLSHWGVVVSQAGDHVEGERYFRECLAIRQELFGSDHPDVASALSNLGWALVNQNRWREAERMCQAALDTLDRSPSAKPEYRRLPLANLIFVLSRQNKFAELELFLEKALQNGTDPGVTALYLDARGSLHARLGRWPKAAADFACAIETQPDNHEHYHKLAPLFISTGDIDGYRKHCAKEVEQFRDTKDPNVAERMAKDCLIIPASGADMDVISAWTDLAVTAGKDSNDLPWFQHAKGLAEYRRQRFAGAVEWAGKALSQRGDPYRDPQAFAVLAMAQHRLGQTNEARIALAQMQELELGLPKLESGDIGENWLDWIIAHALIREACHLIEGGPSADLSKVFSTPETSP